MIMMMMIMIVTVIMMSIMHSLFDWLPIQHNYSMVTDYPIQI